MSASRYQGRRDFNKVIELSLKALELNPRSLMAFFMLADDYQRLGKYYEAKTALLKALEIHPENCQLNYMMGGVLVMNKEPIQKAIPYLKNYLKFKPKRKGKFPWYMSLFSIFFKKKIDWQKYGKELNEYEDAKTQWALKIIEDNKSNQHAGSTGAKENPVIRDALFKITHKVVLFFQQNPSKDNLTLEGLVQEKVINDEDYQFIVKNKIKYNPPSSAGPCDNSFSVFDRNNKDGSSSHMLYTLVDASVPNITKAGTLSDLNQFISEWYGYNSTIKSLNLLKGRNLYYFSLHYWDNEHWNKQHLLLTNFPVDKIDEIEKFKQLLNDNDLRYREDTQQTISSFTVWLPPDLPFIKELSKKILVDVYQLSEKDVINFTPDGFRFEMKQ